MSRPLSFQQVIMRLEQFWGDQGCLIWQPYNVQVGAGTQNPATFLRVLGPEPWRVAYVEPSIRPADGRYGQNPNRTQQFYQYQVILKPDPGNPLELYLQSLRALGIDPREHDVRFVEDNWQAADLGAWGLGWEVWCDGQEITQYTYFQQAGGFALDPVAVEITYGLDRITMYLQGVDHFTDITWGAGLTHGDVLLRSEVEHCIYNFEHANVERMRALYDLYEAEAQSCLERGLVVPSHDYVLKCSHTFNVLDARGAVGVTERAHLFARMRELSRRVAGAYLHQREEMGFPWRPRGVEQVDESGRAEPDGKAVAGELDSDAVLEIGTEELPAQDVMAAIEQLGPLVSAMLGRTRLPYERVWVSGTPRRLVVIVKELAAHQAAEEQVIKGPPASVAYDDEDRPTRAAEGFARRHAVPVEDLQLREMDGGTYSVAVKTETGLSAVQVLARELPDLLASLRFPMTMRWNESNVAFSRPIRWLVALHGGQIIPFVYAAVPSGRVTRGLRPDGSPLLPLASASDYHTIIGAQGIIVDKEKRKASISRQIGALASEVGGAVPEDPELLDEVTDLVEQPTALLGSFPPQYLDLPSEVLITAMKKHQRYFPVVRAMGQGDRYSAMDDSPLSTQSELLPNFIAVRNGGSANQDGVRHGYEGVLRARFADAEFFFETDTQQSLEGFLPRLSTLTFQEQLGSMLDKVHRLEYLVTGLGDALGLSATDRATAARAARLCKADLATQMVVEFTSLQGVMGREYALRSGETEDVAEAIREHHLPRFAGDGLPQTKPGVLLSLADRLDSLVSLFGAGLAPTGSADPYALRRAAIGLIQVLVGQGLDFDLREALLLVAVRSPVEAGSVVQEEVLVFVKGRLEVWLREKGHQYDLVAAVLAERGDNPYAAVRSVRALEFWVKREDWMDILNSYSRCVRIVRTEEESIPLDPTCFTEKATRDLYDAYSQAAERTTAEMSIDGLLTQLETMVPVITRFFDEVLVMAENRALRRNRLALLQRIAGMPKGIVDLSQVEGF